MEVEVLRNRLRTLEASSTIDRTALEAYLNAAVRSIDEVEREILAIREEFAQEVERWRGEALPSLPHPIPEHESLRRVMMSGAVGATAAAAAFDMWTLEAAFTGLWYWGAATAVALTVASAGVFSATSSDALRRRIISQRCASASGLLVAISIAVLMIARYTPPLGLGLNTASAAATAIAAVAVNVAGGALLALSASYGWSRDLYVRYVRLRTTAEALQTVVADAQALSSAERKQGLIARLPVVEHLADESAPSQPRLAYSRADEPLIETDVDLAFLESNNGVIRNYFRALSIATGSILVATMATLLLKGHIVFVGTLVVVCIGMAALTLRCFLIWKGDVAQTLAFQFELHQLRTGLRRASSSIDSPTENAMVAG